jgi:phosphoesterase RecJ-like protein
VGLYNYIVSNYKKQVQLYLEEFSEDFLFMKGAELVRHEVDDEVYDLCIGVDCGDTDRFGEFIKYYNEASRTMCVDHHISNPGFGDVCYVDVAACSAAEALYKLMETDKINRDTAECLYTGIVHDTGVFKHSNTTKSAMCIAGELIEKGARPSFVIDYTFYKKNFSQNKLLGRALTKAKQYHNGKIICAVLEMSDFKETRAKKGDTDGIVDQLRITEGTEVAVFIYQVTKEEYKISLRSNNIVDVSRICVKYGGGGHIRAAGVNMKGTSSKIVSVIIKEIEEQLGEE